MPAEEPPDRRKLVLAAAAIAAIAAISAVELSRRKGGESRSTALFAPQPQTSMPVAQESDELPGSDVEGDRLFRSRPAEAPEPEGELSFGQLVGILADAPKGAKQKKIKDQFVKDFIGEPQLNETYERFKKREADGQRPTASEFMGTLRALPSFQKLANQFVQTSGTAGLLLSIGRNPQVQRFLKADTPKIAAAAAKARGGRAATVRGVLAAQAAGQGGARGRSAAFGGAMESGAAAGAGGGARTTAQTASAVAGQSGAQASGAGAGISPGAQAPSGGGGGGTGPGAGGVGVINGGGGGGGDPNATTPLGTIVDPKTERMKKLLEAFPFLSMFSEAELWDLITGNNPNGLWGACFEKGKYATCFQGCQQAKPTEDNPEISCALPGGSGWTACLDAFDGSVPKCIGMCGQQSPCRVPLAVWTEHCEKRPAPQGWTPPDYCTKQPTWALPGCTASPEVCLLYGKYLGRLPEKGGALGWENEVRRMRSKEPNLTADQIAARLADHFYNSLEAKMQRGETVAEEALKAQNEAYQKFLDEKRIKEGGSLCQDATKCERSADENLVRMLYLEIFGKEPEDAAANDWAKKMGEGMSAAQLEAEMKKSQTKPAGQ